MSTVSAENIHHVHCNKHDAKPGQCLLTAKQLTLSICSKAVAVAPPVSASTWTDQPMNRQSIVTRWTLHTVCCHKPPKESLYSCLLLLM